MISQSTTLTLDMIITTIMGLASIVNDNFHTQLVGAFLLTMAYASHLTLSLGKAKGLSIALEVRSLGWLLQSLLASLHNDFQQLTLTIPMAMLTMYYIFFQDDYCQHGCSHRNDRKLRRMRKKIHELQMRARNHPTVHLEGYKSD